MPKEIHIKEVYARLRTDHDENTDTCRLAIVVSSGKRKGQVRIIANARYGSPSRRIADSPDGKRKSSSSPYEHNDNGTIPITDADRNKYLSPLISHIIGYNEYRVIH
ncbi:MAG: hypothetical protein AAFU67_09755 [Bacteroidota bacterium]